tara:strand:- start:530 stop:1579 length:1050 start_codon:yes stop_codon:yes gene_type:complete
MKKLPFKQHESGGKLIREFSGDVDSSELVWHRDREDRTVVTLSGTGWMLQVENKLPVALSEGSSHLIPKNTYHRIIKGTTKLVVEITEENTALRSYIREVLTESKKSDAFEVSVADAINSLGENITATRPSVGTQYADVLVKVDSQSSWLEVKMNSTDNLSNPRVFYDGSSWKTTYKTPTAQYAIDLLNGSPDAKKFVTEIAAFSGISNPVLPTTKGGLKDPNAVPLEVMREFVEGRGNRYIASEDGIDIGALVTQHYTEGKAEPANYMQSGDSFYLIGGADPLGLSSANEGSIPILGGTGDFKMRVSTRSSFYEIQAEVKIKKFDPANSPFSALGSSNKINPFAAKVK